MAQFRFRGRDGAGQLVTGSLTGNDINAVAEQLRQRGVMPVAIEPEAEQGKGASLDLAALLPVSVALEQLLIFARQLYSLLKAGVPILRAIAGLAQHVHSRHLSDALNAVGNEMEGGRTLSTALSRHPRIFSPLFVALVHVGENTGRLELSFLQLAKYLENEIETRKRIKAALRYPSFVLGAILVALVILNIWVIPTFADMFSKFGAELPLPTRILIGMSGLFVNWGWLLALVGCGLAGAVIFYLNTERGRWRWDRAKLRLPLVGDIIERSTLARFARSFALMLEAGVPLTQALSLSAEAVDNSYLGEIIVGMRRGVESGDSLLRTANASGIFTPLVLQMVAVGEETGRVDELLLEVADYYEREVDYDLKTLTARIEPILIAIVAGMVLVLALGIFLPMWDMMSAMRGGRG